MYGLYLEAVNDYINESYGEDVWRLIENRAEIPHLKFVRHQMYNDNLILRLAKAAGEVLGKTHDELMYAFGVYMVKRIGNYGYERILKVTQRPRDTEAKLLVDGRCGCWRIGVLSISWDSSSSSRLNRVVGEDLSSL
uniref:Heme NO-binding domain-containing protein n=1 Tax=Knipowitschia caucasica TaxID=637954 RepID=A0AAV2MES5_KNICA